MPWFAETFRRKSTAIRIKLSEKPHSRIILRTTMCVKSAIKQNLRMDLGKNASIANSKFARDVVHKSLFRDQNR